MWCQSFASYPIFHLYLFVCVYFLHDAANLLSISIYNLIFSIVAIDNNDMILFFHFISQIYFFQKKMISFLEFYAKCRD